MNECLTRQDAIAKGLPTCYGSPCKKHPELEGLRRVSGACVQCAKKTLDLQVIPWIDNIRKGNSLVEGVA